MDKYIKKPIQVRAIQFTNKNKDKVLNELRDIQNNIIPTGINVGEEPGLLIPTLDGETHVSLNDWVIQGLHGELYTCKPDIFDETYEKVN